MFQLMLLLPVATSAIVIGSRPKLTDIQFPGNLGWDPCRAMYCVGACVNGRCVDSIRPITVLPRPPFPFPTPDPIFPPLKPARPIEARSYEPPKTDPVLSPIVPCGGFLGLKCEGDQICVDVPNDGCDPRYGGADCPGMCVPSDPGPPVVLCGPIVCAEGQTCASPGMCVATPPRVIPCGGIADPPCPFGLKCVDNPNDGCDPDLGDADCRGMCMIDSYQPSDYAFAKRSAAQRTRYLGDEPPEPGTGCNAPTRTVRRSEDHVEGPMPEFGRSVEDAPGCVPPCCT